MVKPDNTRANFVRNAAKPRPSTQARFRRLHPPYANHGKGRRGLHPAAGRRFRRALERVWHLGAVRFMVYRCRSADCCRCDLMAWRSAFANGANGRVAVCDAHARRDGLRHLGASMVGLRYPPDLHDNSIWCAGSISIRSTKVRPARRVTRYRSSIIDMKAKVFEVVLQKLRDGESSALCL